MTANDPIFGGLAIHQAKLAVFKAIANPTRDDGKAVNTDRWDVLLGFKVLFLGRVSEPKHGTKSPEFQGHL